MIFMALKRRLCPSLESTGEPRVVCETIPLRNNEIHDREIQPHVSLLSDTISREQTRSSQVSAKHGPPTEIRPTKTARHDARSQQDFEWPESYIFVRSLGDLHQKPSGWPQPRIRNIWGEFSPIASSPWQPSWHKWNGSYHGASRMSQSPSPCPRCCCTRHCKHSRKKPRPKLDC
jgi:hypothetical protein